MYNKMYKYNNSVIVGLLYKVLYTNAIIIISSLHLYILRKENVIPLCCKIGYHLALQAFCATTLCACTHCAPYFALSHFAHHTVLPHFAPHALRPIILCLLTLRRIPMYFIFLLS